MVLKSPVNSSVSSTSTLGTSNLSLRHLTKSFQRIYFLSALDHRGNLRSPLLLQLLHLLRLRLLLLLHLLVHLRSNLDTPTHQHRASCSLFQRVVQPTLFLALLRLTLLARVLLHAATLRLRNLLVRRRTQHNGFLLLRLWLLMLVLALLVEQQTALAMMLHAHSNRHGIARDRLLVQLR